MTYFFLSVTRTLKLLLQLLIVYVTTFVLIPEHTFAHSFSYSSGWTLINRVDNMQRHSYLQMGTKWTLDRVRDVSSGVQSRSELRRKCQGAYQAAWRNDWWAELSSALRVSPRIRHHYWTLELATAEAAKYSNKTAFYKGNQSAYRAARSNRTLDLICAHMKPRKRWNFQELHSEALKYDIKLEFRSASPSAYSAAKRMKWLPFICGHMQDKRRPEAYWTSWRVREEALQYDSRTAFKKGSSGAYKAARKNDILDEVCRHMIDWTLERVRKEALKYELRSEFQVGSFDAYMAAWRSDWLDDVCGHMRREGGDAALIETLRRSSLDYHMRSLFKKGDYHSYNVARANDLLDVICSHMKPIKWWELEEVHEIALKYNSRSEFEKESRGAYGAARRNGWLDDVCSHMTPLIHPEWTLEQLRKEALKYDSRSDFENGSSGAYTAALRNGWMDDVCSHMIPRRHPAGYWTLELVKEEALKYTSRSAFQKESGSAYDAAQRNGWLDAVCSHMDTKNVYPPGYWTCDRVKEEALKYKSRREFQKGSRGAYGAAQRNGWLDDVCGHMIQPVRENALLRDVES